MKNFTIREKQCLGSGSGEKYGSTDQDPMAKYQPKPKKINSKHH